MNDITLKAEEVQKLLGAGNADALLLFVCEKSGISPLNAGLDSLRTETAAAYLRQVGLWQTPAPRFQQSSEPPVYSEADVTRALSDPSSEFRKVEAETQRRLGKVLSTEDLKILLSIHEYLGLSLEVISVLITYCIERSRSRGSNRRPSFRAIEQEAYRWADEGIDTVETACAYVMANTAKNVNVRAVSQLMGLGSRALTQSEERYIVSWLNMGFGIDEIRFAYDKTCVNTGQLKWPYMDSILKSWDSQGLHTLEQIEKNDRPAQKKAGGKQSDCQKHGESLSPLMRQAVQQLLSDEEKE